MKTAFKIAKFLSNHNPDEARVFLNDTVIPELSEKEQIEDKVLRINNILCVPNLSAKEAQDNIIFAFGIDRRTFESMSEVSYNHMMSLTENDFDTFISMLENASTDHPVIEAVQQDPSLKIPEDSFVTSSETITLSPDAFDRFVDNCFGDPRPLSEKIKKVAADLDEKRL